MSSFDKKKVGRGKPWRGLSLALAGLGWLAMCFGATAQVSVDTIGGGVRVECGSASGFVGGDTWTNAQFNEPYSCALDTNGNLWIADRKNSDIEQVTQAGNKTSSLTSEIYTESQSYVTNSKTHVVTTVTATNLHAFTNVTAVAVDPANNLYVLLPSPPEVIKATLATETTSLNLLSILGLANYPASALPSAMAVDGNSNVFIAFTNGVILQFPLLDSNPPPALYLENYSNTARYIVSNNFQWQPAGLALRADGSLAVSDVLSNAIYLVSTNSFGRNNSTTNRPQLVTGAHGAGFDDGSPFFAQFDQPTGLAASADGRLIVCDTMNNRLRVIDTLSNTTTLYGTASNVWTTTCCECDPTLYAGWVDGPTGTTTTSASGRLPASVVISPSGSLFVTELFYSLIRQVTNTDFTQINLAASPPVAVTEPVTTVMNGTVDAGNQQTYYYFEWGTTTNYGSFTVTNLLTTDLTSAQDVTGSFTNLLPGLIYHFQLVAYNGAGTSYGGDVIAVTPALPAFLETEPAINITGTSATLQAIINPENSVTTVNFLWGTTTNLTNSTGLITLTNNLLLDQTVSNTLTGLQSGTIYYFQATANNPGGTTNGNVLLFSTLTLAPPIISFSPSNGYFPDCEPITVTSSVPTFYYTTDGSAPTTNSAEVTLTNMSGTNFTGTIEWCNPQQNLSALELLAFNGTVPTIVQGSFPTTNLIGFPQVLAGGPGAHLYIPVVVELQSSTALESLQFRVEINANQGGTPNIASLDLQPLTPSDFVPLPGPAPGNTPVTFQTFPYTTSSNGQGMVITAEGGTSGLDMTGSGVVVMLHLQIPTTATYGESYSLSVLDPSGTSDGQQGNVVFATLSTQTLNTAYTPYMVGDSSPSTGYDAEQFGLKAVSGGVEEVGLDNADVNNAIYASAGIRVPPSDSDIFNAMDAYPPDSAGHGGDGVIQYLDWETILGRSLGVPIYLGMDTNNYLRFWTNGDTSYPSHSTFNWAPGELEPLPVPADPPPPAPGPSKLALAASPPGLVWLCEASVGSGTIIDALPGNTYSLPVYVKVAPGYSLAGMQFRAIVTGNPGAPAVTSIQFNAAGGVTPPQVLPGLAGNDKVHAWSFGSFPTPLQNSNYLGTISFTVPSGADPGAFYTLHFSGVDGAPDFSIDYQMESHPGFVWVMSAALQPASMTSDEWKIAFFGSLTNSLAGDNVDADGDGAPNWQEYLAGTNPTNALSRLQFSSASLDTSAVRGVAINWVTAPGKTYILESSPALNGAAWTPINTNSGDGNDYQCIVTNLSGNSHFYQIRLQP